MLPTKFEFVINLKTAKAHDSLGYVRCAHKGGRQHALRLFRPKP
jgi:hypothetical protein